jgi:RsiW-degrading membrane proteinase PrsW (M82 family)
MDLLLLALAPVLAVLWFYWRQDRHPEPLAAMAIVFCAGFLACGVAYPLERWAQQFFPPGQRLFLECLLVPGLIEESVKLLVVVVAVWWRRDFDEPVDGLVYGTAAALGFTFGEDWRYYLAHGADVSRIFSIAAHPWFSCLWAAALGIARFQPWRRGLPLVLGGLAASALVHGVFDWCILAADVKPTLSWLRYFVGPLMIVLYLKMDWLIEVMHRRQATSTSGAEVKETSADFTDSTDSKNAPGGESVGSSTSKELSKTPAGLAEATDSSVTGSKHPPNLESVQSA